MLAFLLPVLLVNQEMVCRLGAVSGVGHARLMLARFGRFWDAFAVVDLLALNALTLITELIGVTLALGYFGLPRTIAVPWPPCCCWRSAPPAASAAGNAPCTRSSPPTCWPSPPAIWLRPTPSEIMHGALLPGVPLGLITVGLLVVVSLAFTTTTLLPDLAGPTLGFMLLGGAAIGLALTVVVIPRHGHPDRGVVRPLTRSTAGIDRKGWRMPPLSSLRPPHLSSTRKLALLGLRAYLLVRRPAIGPCGGIGSVDSFMSTRRVA